MDETLLSIAGRDIDECSEINQFERSAVQISLKDCEKYTVNKRDFTKQYASIYAARFRELKYAAGEAALKKWGGVKAAGPLSPRKSPMKSPMKSPRKSPKKSPSKTPSTQQAPVLVEKILDLIPARLCIIVGTIHKECPLLPSVLQQYEQERAIIGPPKSGKYWSASDTVVLEDDSGRIKLIGPKLKSQDLVTGCIMAAIGRENQDGEFELEDITPPGIPPQISRKKKSAKSSKILLLSSLALGSPNTNHFSLDLLTEFITGYLGAPVDHEYQSKINTVIIAGNVYCSPNEEENSLRDSSANKRQRDIEKSIGVGNRTKMADSLIAQWCTSVDVVLLPGDEDPSNYCLPQQPFNRCLLPLASSFNTLWRVTNPCSFNLDSTSFFGGAGQTVSSIEQFVDVDNPLDVMQQTLVWRHIAPTAPDILGTVPFQDDPFIIYEAPHIYFMGNQKCFDSRKIKGDQGQEILLISIPKFSETGNVVLLDYETLDCQCVNFASSCPMMEV